MICKIVISPKAIAELQEIIKWYNDKKPSLGDDFKIRAKATINNLKENHFSFQIRYSDVRCCQIFKFPYLIHFKIFENDEIVVITTIKHTSRNPNIWLDPENE